MDRITRSMGTIRSRLLRKPIFRQMISEFLGTFTLVLFAIGLGAQTTLSYGSAGSALSATLGTGFAVMMGVQIAGKMSGAHINPIMSLGLAWAGKFPWYKVPGYMFAQYLGGFTAAGLAYFVYKDALFSFNGGAYSMQTAAVWASFPAPFVPLWNAFFDALIAAAFLCMLNFAVADRKNMDVQMGFSPMMYGLVVTCIGSGFSYNDGNPMNPARDFGPRMFLLMSGWGKEVLYGPNYAWWWVPLVAPHIGALIGATIYVLMIENNHPTDEDTSKDTIEAEPAGYLLIEDKGERSSKF